MKSIRKISILWALLLCTLPVLAQESPASAFAGSDAVDKDKCAVLIIDLKTKKVIDSHNADTPLVPASVNKVVTIASLLKESGKDYRYRTDVYLGGKVKDGTLQGNLIVKGGGDPSLGTSQGPEGSDFIASVVSALKKREVVGIQGDIIVDGSVFPGPATPPTWAAGDLSQAYGAGCYGLNWQRNSSGDRAVADPIGRFRGQLLSALGKAGISVKGDSVESRRQGKPIVSFYSKPVEDIMRYCMKQSDNLYAEAFLRTYGLLKEDEGTTDAGAKAELKYWSHKGSPVKNVEIKDGSGLSRSNRITARFLGDVLVRMAKDPYFVSFFPMCGVEGTVRNFLKGTSLEDYMALKTGSMRGIQCYAGYKVDENYAPTHAVVVLINSFPKDRQCAREVVKTMLINTFINK